MTTYSSSSYRMDARGSMRGEEWREWSLGVEITPDDPDDLLGICDATGGARTLAVLDSISLYVGDDDTDHGCYVDGRPVTRRSVPNKAHRVSSVRYERLDSTSLVDIEHAIQDQEIRVLTPIGEYVLNLTGALVVDALKKAGHG
jgi:hypothetical protein